MFEVAVNPDVLMDTCAFLDDLGVRYGISDKADYVLLLENGKQRDAVEFIHKIIGERYNAN